MGLPGAWDARGLGEAVPGMTGRVLVTAERAISPGRSANDQTVVRLVSLSSVTRWPGTS